MFYSQMGLNTRIGSDATFRTLFIFDALVTVATVVALLLLVVVVNTGFFVSDVLMTIDCV